MTGTEKQIAWAEDIKANAIGNADSIIKSALDKYHEYDEHPGFLTTAKAYKIMRAVLVCIFAAHDDAEYIINHRSVLLNYTSTVDRWAELIRTNEKTAAQIAAQNGLKDYKEE